LHVNASTVARAYRLLEQQGVVETHQRRGTTVTAADGTELRDLRHLRLRQVMERTLVETLALGFTLDEVEAAFGLQLAAWHERRSQPAPVERVAGGDYLYCFAGSHDLALEALWAQARRGHPAEHFDVRYLGSLDGLLHLLRGEAGLAGAHLLDEETGEYNLPILRRLFVGQRLCVVTLAEREQGLIVAAGNPKKLASLQDLARPDVRIINRQPGSGTRALLDYHLRCFNIPARSVAGYEREAATHTAVADSVARGQADAGLGLQAAAHAFGLGFIPVARERYDLVMLADARTLPPLSWLLDSISTSSFRTVVAALDGYDAAHTGEEVYV
jgi:molybdate-binding protein